MSGVLLHDLEQYSENGSDSFGTIQKDVSEDYHYYWEGLKFCCMGHYEHDICKTVVK